MAWLFLSWSSRSSLFFLTDKQIVADEILRMQRDDDNDQIFEENVEDTPGLADVNYRSVWDILSELQIFLVLSQAGWCLTGAVLHFYASAHDAIFGSQIIEDAFNVR